MLATAGCAFLRRRRRKTLITSSTSSSATAKAMQISHSFRCSEVRPSTRWKTPNSVDRTVIPNATPYSISCLRSWKMSRLNAVAVSLRALSPIATLSKAKATKPMVAAVAGLTNSKNHST